MTQRAVTFDEAGQRIVRDALPEDAQPLPGIVDVRANTSTPRAQFLNACVTAQIITEAVAEEAAGGGWPSAFNTFLTGLTAAQRVEAISTWADNPVVWRNSPLLAQISGSFDPALTDAQLDALCGIA